MAEKKERLVDTMHMFSHDGMRYGLFRAGKPYDARSAKEMQEYYRKKMGMAEDEPITMTSFRRLLQNNFKIDVKSIPGKDRNKPTDKEKEYMRNETAGESDREKYK